MRFHEWLMSWITKPKRFLYEDDHGELWVVEGTKKYRVLESPPKTSKEK